MTSRETTGFSIADRDYFIGLVAMLASVRRQGHDFPVVVLDVGLTAPQCVVLERDFGVRVVKYPEVEHVHPFLLGPFPHLLDPTGIVVYLDADLIVTRPLDDLLAAAADGKLCAVPDSIVGNRWIQEWEAAFALAEPLRHGTYVNLGCVAFSTEHFPDLLGRWWECCMELVGTLRFPTSWTEPFAFGDQDVLNALLMSEIPEECQLILPPNTQTMGSRELERTRLIDSRTLACTFEGQPTLLLHPVSEPKPWQPQRHQAMSCSGYERCLRELVVSCAASVRASGTPLPAWLEPGWRGTWRWRRAASSTRIRRGVRQRLSLLKRRVLASPAVTSRRRTPPR